MVSFEILVAFGPFWDCVMQMPHGLLDGDYVIHSGVSRCPGSGRLVVLVRV